jgi:LacI family transcriptional regulator
VFSPHRQRAARAERQKRVLMALAYYDHRMHRGVAEFARKANWVLDTTMAHYGGLPDYWRGDGILTVALPNRPELIRFLRGMDVPIVALTNDVEGIADARVVLDNWTIGRIAAEHFIERGFKHLAFYKYSDFTDIRQREAGFAAAVKEAGLAYTRLDWHAAAKKHPRLNPFRWLGRQLLALPQPLGVMAQSDHRAYFLLCVCEEVGLRAPEQVAVAGVDNDVYTCEFAPTPITSVDSNRQEYAYQAASMLDRLMRGEKPPNEPVLIPPTGLVVRRSSDILAMEDPEVAKALGFIWQNFRDKIGVDDVVDATSLSRCVLYRDFQNLVGRTIREELERKRIELACQLLLSTSDKVSHIARQCGFSSGEQFCRAFFRVEGLTPRDFRKRPPSPESQAAEAPAMFPIAKSTGRSRRE